MCLKKRKKGFIIALISIMAIGCMLLFTKSKISEKEVNHKQVHNVVAKENKYIEYASMVTMKTKSVSETIFFNKTIDITDNFRYDKNNSITVSQRYRLGFGIDNSDITIKANDDSLEVIADSKDIKLLYRQSIGDLVVLSKEESIGNKIKDVFHNDDESVLLNATNQLNKTSKKMATDSLDIEYAKSLLEKDIKANITKILGEDINIKFNIK